MYFWERKQNMAQKWKMIISVQKLMIPDNIWRGYIYEIVIRIHLSYNSTVQYTQGKNVWKIQTDNTAEVPPCL